MNKYIILIIGIFFVSSCKDDLKQINPNKITYENFFNNVKEASQALNSVYSVLKRQQTVGVLDENFRADMLVNGLNRGASTTNPFYNQDFNSSTANISERWSSLYRGIFYANQVIEGTEKINVTTENEILQKKYILGQAYFFRGLFHYWASLLFNNGNIIIRRSVPTSNEDYYCDISNKADVLELVIEDLSFASNNLPDKWDGDNLGRVTSGAALAYIGQMYLYERNYKEAIKYFKEVLNKGYKLVENISDNFCGTKEFNEESIFEINYSKTFKSEYNGGNDLGLSQSISRGLTSAETGGWGANTVPLWMIEEFLAEQMDPNDARNKDKKMSLRATATIAYVQDDLDKSYYGYTPYYRKKPELQETKVNFKNQCPAYYKKFTSCLTDASEDATKSQSSVNISLMRLADVYLMLAEALIEGGNDDNGVKEAIFYINKIRKRSGLILLGTYKEEYAEATYDEKTYTAAELMEHLMWKERPLELCLEGFAMRAIDLRRWGKTKDRFMELSSRKYQFWDLTTFSGVKDARFWLPKRNDELGKYSDYTKAAKNFIPEIHSFYPIPLSEIQSNNKINK